MPQEPFGETYGGSAPENYERFFVPAIGAPVAEDLVAKAALRPGERVLDVGCGTGVVARMAALRVGAEGAVAGLDVNPGMLAVARSSTPAGTSIEWHEASAEDMPLPDGSFDVVLCQMSLQFVPDRQAALNEMERVLAPGGRLLLNVPGPTPEPFLVLGEALERHVGAEAAGFVNLLFSLHDPGDLRELVEGAGFRDASAGSDTKSLRLPAPKDFLWRYVHSTPLAGAVARVDQERRAAIESDVVERWERFVEEGFLVLQVGITTVTARK
jgi:SAM-dependent methyltransferase